jgi:hypothetical protein
MSRFLCALVASILLLPATALAGGRVPDNPSLPVVYPVDLSGVEAPERLPDLGAKPRIPEFLKFSSRGDLHAADHWAGMDVREEQFQDVHGHVLTFATDNPAVDLTRFAELLASTYHGDEIEFVHVFVTNTATLEETCGADAAACYGADNPGHSRGGVMIVSYEDSNIAHAVIHEYGHHIDANTYNLGGLNGCSVAADGSRRWFFAREMRDRILENLSCDPRPGWGQLLPEVFAEDYAQLVGIPRAEYHSAIVVAPPSARQKRLLKKDLDQPFGPRKLNFTGRSSGARSAAFTLSTTLPVFVKVQGRKGVRSVKLRGCNFQGFRDVFAGRCRVDVKTKRPSARFRFKLAIL